MKKNMLCKNHSTVLDVMKMINANGKGTAFIIDQHNKLCGVVTDGDIRRFLLKSNDLLSVVSKVMRPDFIYAQAGETIDEMLAKLSKTVHIIPVVDKKCKVIDFIEDRKIINLPIAEPDLTGNELRYLIDAFLSTYISNKGEYVERFEKNFSQFCECRYGVAVSNGTVALHLALVALGVGKGDEVIVPDLTFAATINAVLHAQATPVIVDIEKESWCIDPKEIKKAITPKTKAILPVHLYGQPCDMNAIMMIARRHRLFVIEDCAEAHGAKFNGKKLGSFGDIGCFSFYGNKIITTGEGGMCVTNAEKLDARMRILRDHGMSKTNKYWHDAIGYNYRLTNLQAAIGVAQLERIEEILSSRKNVEEIYRKNLSGIHFLEFQRDNLPKREKITWLVSFLINNGKKDVCVSKLKESGIDVRNFFYPLSEMALYKKYVFSNTNSRLIAQKGINLPTVCNNLVKNRLKEIKTILKNV